jgi:hypothetical protein
VAYLFGSYTGLSGHHPLDFFMEGAQATATLAQEKTADHPIYLRHRYYEGTGVLTHERDRVQPGLTAIQGWFSEGPEVRLVDLEGAVLRRWKLDFFELWPEPAHMPAKLVPKSSFGFHSQGMVMTPDGSVVATIPNCGTVKFDRSGAVAWTVDRRTHHSVTRAVEGGFWLPVNRDLADTPRELILPGVALEVLEKDGLQEYDQLLLRVGDDGATLEEIPLLPALIDAGLDNHLYDVVQISPADPTHLNDIEPVTAALAARIEGVSEGDLLVSIRQMHLLAILDRETGALLWHEAGPWSRQHDPDITPEGTIVVYSNRPGRGASKLLEHDPATGKTRVVHPVGDGAEPFKGPTMGVHQLLPNGNRLITEAVRGRVFEVDAAGEKVWEYVAAYDEELAAMIEGAARYDQSYFTAEAWSDLSEKP